MRILVTGKSGQLGKELAIADWPARFQLTYADRSQCDLGDPKSVVSMLEAVQPNLVINGAAYTAVDRAENEAGLAMRVNAEAPAEIARWCARTGASLLQISTDYVFDGTNRAPYGESDPVAPLSVYGRTKEAGEAAIRLALERHVIVRTSWVFSSHGSNFVKTMLRLGAHMSTIRVVADQSGSPTWAGDLARALRTISTAVAEGNGKWGTYHFSGASPTNWCGFAAAVFERSGCKAKIEPITSAEFGAAARRPANSVLDCSRIRRIYGIDQPSWRDALDKVLLQLGGKGELT